MAGGMTSEFIETGYRRARKYGGAFGTATQNYGDYFKSSASQAALQNADWTFTLRQKSESIDVLEEKGMLGVANDPFIKRSLHSLTMIGGRYSEMMISYPLGSGVVRFMAEPFSGFLYSSKHEQFDRVQTYKKQGMTIGEAVEKAMTDFGIQHTKPIKYE
jgi:conjugal transfer ATP-binding protein TraC